jgi:hypothetical protein
MASTVAEEVAIRIRAWQNPLQKRLFSLLRTRFWVAQRFQCVRENSLFEPRVEQPWRFLAAKRRKNAAHGVSRGGSGKHSSPGGAKDEFSRTLVSAGMPEVEHIESASADGTGFVTASNQRGWGSLN